MDTDKTVWLLIQRYVSGNATPDERRKLNRWMDETPENRHLVQEVEKIWDLTPEEKFEVNVQEAWEKFHEENVRESLRRKVEASFRNSSNHDHLISIYRAAAVLLVVLFTGLLAGHQISQNSDAEQTAGFHVMQMQDLITGKGEKARVTFSDGTEVVLNSASSITFPEEFQGANREVYLDGEAYFKVTHDPDHPFIVNSQGISVQVLGTEFNIRGWSGDPSVDVAVRDGKVSVNAFNKKKEKDSEVILTEDLYTTVKKGGVPSPPKKVDVRKHLLWTSGGLNFDDEPFGQVILNIERRFNVDINVSADEDIRNVPFTGAFQQADLDEVLSVVAASMEMEYSRKGSVVEFF